MTDAAADHDEEGGLEAELLAVVRELAAEVKPEARGTLRVETTSRLDRDLGLDSLARSELMLRIERGFDVALPEEVLARAETPGDILAVLAGLARGARANLKARAREETVAGGPLEAPAVETIPEALAWHVSAHGNRTHITLVGDAGEEREITYRALDRDARRLASGLVARGLESGARVAIMLPSEQAFFTAFMGVLLAACVPVPIYPPVRLSQIEDHLRRQAVILNNCEAVLLITVEQARAVGDFLIQRVASLEAVETVDRLGRIEAGALPPPPGPDDLALLQYTSGSTGDPKGVMLSHRNLLANIRAMGLAIQPRDGDVFVSWLPLYHDMGLIGAWLGTMYFAIPVVIMSPLAFLVRPGSWLWAIHRHRGTLSGGPNFAFELCLRRIEDGDIEGLDLSSLRMVVNGAEPVLASTIREFSARFAGYGLAPTAMAPVFGLAENAVGLAFPPLDRVAPIDRVDRQALQLDGIARPAAEGDENALEMVACGHPLPGHQIRVVDAAGREVGERREGRLQFQGPSTTAGYYRNPERTAEMKDGAWTDSGDRAYLAAGDLYITGRVKDIVIRAGRNIYPQEVEVAVGALDGVRTGCVAVFGTHDAASGTERLVVVAESRERDPKRRAALVERISAIAGELVEQPPDEVVLAPPHAVPKTSSGKIRRDATRQLYEAGTITADGKAVWLQLARLYLAGAAGGLRRRLRGLGAVLYAAHWWAMLLLVAVVVWPGAQILPGFALRWALVHGAARLFFRLIGVRIRVEGAERLHAFRGIVLLNHSSYADTLGLSAIMEGPLAVVAKKELADQFIAGRFLQSLGCLFVERARAEEAMEDATATRAAVDAGRQVVFFPEGTLTRMPGLLGFRMGAFTIAAEGGVPVLPVGVRGMRTLLRDGQWFPRHGSVDVRVGEPLSAEGEDFSAAVRLRDQARRQMLDLVGEPDLAAEVIDFATVGKE